MTILSEFIRQYIGKKDVGNTKDNRGECVGLVSIWQDTFNVPHVWGHAKDLYLNSPSEYFDKILQSPKAYPIEGDILCWGETKGSGDGHTAIVISSDPKKDTVEVFESNNPYGEPPRIHTYSNWSGIIGWLRPKEYANIENQGLGFDFTKKLVDKLWELFNFDKASGLPRKTSVDSVYKEWNKITKQLEDVPDCSDQIESAVKTSSEALESTHRKDLKKITTAHLTQVEDIKQKHLDEVKVLKEYKHKPSVEGLKEIGRWVLFGAFSFLIKFLLEAAIPAVQMDTLILGKTLGFYVITALTFLQRYIDKEIHENYIKVKGENAISNAVNWVEGRAVEEISKLPIRGLLPF